jgi:hypothetical protein
MAGFFDSGGEASNWGKPPDSLVVGRISMLISQPAINSDENLADVSRAVVQS